MAERRNWQGHEPVGSVAEETARLVEALGGWAEGLRTPPAAGPDHAAEGAEPDGAGSDGAGPDGAQPAGRPGPEWEKPPSATPDGEAGTRHTAACEQCGVPSRAGEALTCQLCPLCQGIAVLRTVRPETVERLADLAAALSGALRDIAADRFGPPPAPPPRPPHRGQRVQDISVDDEDEPEPARTDTPRRAQENTAP